jgi:hypothetical protein
MPRRTAGLIGPIDPRVVTSSEADPPPLDHDLRTLVTVARTHPSDFGQRQVIVRIDDGPPTRLLFGQQFTIELQPGAHTLRANNTLFFKRRAFHLEPGEHLEFLLINCGRLWTYSMVAILGSAPLFLKIIKRSLA